MGSVLTIKDPPFPATVQCYYQLPRAANYLLDLLVFVLLMLSGMQTYHMTCSDQSSGRGTVKTTNLTNRP